MKSYKIGIQHALILLLISDVIIGPIVPSDSKILKLVTNTAIYFSLIFIPYRKLFSFGNLISKRDFIFYLAIIGYGFISIFRDLFGGELLTLFGNKYIGPAFLVPLFLVYSFKDESLYFLHRVSILSVKIGIILSPIMIFFNWGNGNFLFIPTFFLLLNYNYCKLKDRIVIVISMVVAPFVYYFTDLRSGIARIIICLGAFLLIQIGNFRLYKYGALLAVILPFVLLYISIITGESVFTTIMKESEGNEFVVDSRTFLFVELFQDLDRNNAFTFGKGPLGRYYSEYFDKLEGSWGDHFMRLNIEVGMLSYLFKGVLVYLILICVFLVLAILNSLNKSNNHYIPALGVVIAGFFMFSFIENIPSFGIYFAMVWIIVGVIISKKYKKLSDLEIRNLITNRNKDNI